MTGVENGAGESLATGRTVGSTPGRRSGNRLGWLGQAAAGWSRSSHR